MGIVQETAFICKVIKLIRDVTRKVVGGQVEKNKPQFGNLSWDYTRDFILRQVQVNKVRKTRDSYGDSARKLVP